MDHQHLESLYPETSRFMEIEKILGFVKRGDSCQVIAMPGVGRGNLLKFLAYNRNIRIKHLGEKQTAYHFVFVNFDEIKHRPVIDGLKFIFLELLSSLRERRLDEAFSITDKICKESLKYHDELVLFQGLKEAIDFLTAEKKLHITLLFERFENYVPMLTADFFTYLRSLRNHAKYKFSVVFSTTRPLEDSIEPAILADFYEYFATHDVYPTLTDDPGIRFRIHYLEQLTNQKLGETCIENILSLTAGHAKLTRLSVEFLLGQNPVNASDSVTTDRLLSQKTLQNALKEIWDFLSPSEQHCVHQLIEKKEEACNIFLEKIHLVKNGSLSIPLFTPFVEKIKREIPMKEEHITYEEKTNTINKGNLVISERLTASEFRLLRFLIGNPSKVLDREEIINAVWKETASTLGVTDQALDQLIFRLRKKTEENPNNPQHILTVKGRGVSFVP